MKNMHTKTIIFPIIKKKRHTNKCRSLNVCSLTQEKYCDSQHLNGVTERHDLKWDVTEGTLNHF